MPKRCKTANANHVALHRATERFARGPKSERLRQIDEFEALVGSFLEQIEEHYRKGADAMGRAKSIMPDDPGIASNHDHFVMGMRAVHYIQHQLTIRCQRIRNAVQKNNRTNVKV